MKSRYNFKNLKKFNQREQDVQFAKELFKIWDEYSNGRLDIGELALPMIGMGLIQSRQSILKLMAALSVGDAPEKVNVTIVDFVKIFKTNPFIDRTIEAMKVIIKR
jgi:Ca2+-binding EF-hand superfamily protein